MQLLVSFEMVPMTPGDAKANPLKLNKPTKPG